MINVFRNLDWSKLVDILLSVIPVLICITIHECCHGFTALALGDNTAKNMGRLSLNPIKHFDLIGFILLLVIGFGWAKPVPVNMYNFKNPKRGMAITALAGPVSNIVLACLMFFVYGFIYSPLHNSTIGYYVLYMISQTAYLSITLAIFNIIPIPPLDGSKILFSFLPDNAYEKLMRYEKYGMILLIVLLMTNIVNSSLSTAAANVFDKLSFFVRIGSKFWGVFS